jgi:hypothetical protein
MTTYANYDSYGTPLVKYPYLLNQTYPTTGDNDFTTMDGLATEFYLLYGTDINFLPRELHKEDTTFGEFLSATIEKGYPLRMFLEEVEAWSGNGDMYSKFGLQVTDEATLYINKSSFLAQTQDTYPKQGDLIYVEKSQKLFQIKHVEDEVQPAFYLLGNRAGFKFTCGLFAYNHEAISQNPATGIPAAVQALDALLNDMDGNVVALPEKEFNQNNKPVIVSATPIIDTTERDPLQG